MGRSLRRGLRRLAMTLVPHSLQDAGCRAADRVEAAAGCSSTMRRAECRVPRRLALACHGRIRTPLPLPELRDDYNAIESRASCKRASCQRNRKVYFNTAPQAQSRPFVRVFRGRTPRPRSWEVSSQHVKKKKHQAG